jgi:predicted RNase H-like HicB family nuclease
VNKPLSLETVIYKEGDYYVAQCLDVDVSSFGTTENEATTNLKEALELYFEDTDNKNITQVQSPKVRQLTVQVT